MHFSAVETAVNYAYTGEVRITTAIAPQLYLLSLKLQDQWLEEMCIEFITSRWVCPLNPSPTHSHRYMRDSINICEFREVRLAKMV